MAWKVWTESSGDGRWRCRWRGDFGTGQHTFLYKADARDLEDHKRRSFQRQEAGLPPLPESEATNRLTIPALRKQYESWLKSRRSVSTQRITRRTFDLWEQFGGDSLPVTQKEQRNAGHGKTVSDFSDWLMARKGKRDNVGQRANGVRITLSHFKAAIKWAIRHGLLDSDPFIHFEFPAKVKVSRYLTAAQLIAILKEIPLLPRRAVYFNLHVGLRSGELDRLDWSGIRRNGDTVYLTVLKSKTRRTSGEASKTVALSPNAVLVLGPFQESGKIFNLGRDAISYHIRRAAAKLGIGRVRWHDLRHTWATDFMEKHRDLRALMSSGGWSTVENAMIYQHQTPDRAALTSGSKIDPKDVFGPH